MKLEPRLGRLGGVVGGYRCRVGSNVAALVESWGGEAQVLHSPVPQPPSRSLFPLVCLALTIHSGPVRLAAESQH